MFDYATAAERAGISPENLVWLVFLMRAKLPSAGMMAELHILRTDLSVERGMRPSRRSCISSLDLTRPASVR